jgi:hypothetical protein
MSEEHRRNASSEYPELTAIELHRIVSLKEAARLRGESQDNLKRHNKDKIVRLSTRRLGMKLGHALMLLP